MRNNERMAGENRLRAQLKRSRKRRAEALALFESSPAVTYRHVAEKFGVIRGSVTEMLRRARFERAGRRLHGKG